MRTATEMRWFERLGGGLFGLACGALATSACAPAEEGPTPPAPPSERVADVSQASSIGQWTAPFFMPIDGLHAHLLPTGKVWFFGYNDGSFMWDPNTGNFRASVSFSYNPFCAGHSFLPSGEMLITGGHDNANTYGLWNASVFDPFTETLTMVSDLDVGRWYPTNITLPNGDVFVLDGNVEGAQDHASTPQVWETANRKWRSLTTAVKAVTPYAQLHILPNGKIFLSGPDVINGIYDPTGTGSYTDSDYMAANRFFGTSTQFAPGKILAIGGTAAASTPQTTSEVIDWNKPAPAWVLGSNMAYPRQLHNSVLLPDGSVLVVGGSSAPGFNNSAGPVYTPELWDPVTQVFTPMAPQAVYRGYHSIGMLLPDARVLSSSGVGYENGEIFSPPYLFLGPQPALDKMPETLDYGDTFTVESTDAANIARISMLRLSAITHGTNSDQRIAFLPFTLDSGKLTVTMVDKPELGPPGYYMLFLLDTLGVPSKGTIFRLGSGLGSHPHAPRPPVELTAKVLSASAIKLGWRDESNNEDGFRIERTQSSGRYKRIADVPANTTTYVDTSSDLKPGKSYVYRVRAMGLDGYSPYSERARAVTP